MQKLVFNGVTLDAVKTMRIILNPRQTWRYSLYAVNSFCRGFSTSMSNQQRLDISGIYPPIATPFNNDESIAFDKLEDNFKKWNKLPFRGMIIIDILFK